jgi:hypothetical protein
MLRRPNVVAFFDDNRGRDIRSLLAYSIVQARDFAIDRKRAVSEGFTDDEITQVLSSSAPHAASTMLTRAHLALREEDGFRSAKLDQPSEVEISQAIRAITLDPRALPAFRVSSEVLNNFALRIRQQDPGSNRFGQHQSAWFDMLHCGAGAAYCDVFTCDTRTAQDLGDIRTALRRQPQLTERGCGGPHDFVQAIEAQLAAAYVGKT